MDRAESPGSSWRSPAAMPQRWLAGMFAVSALYSTGVFVISSDYVHEAWGAAAACGYGVATIATLIPWRVARRVLRRPTAGADFAVAVAFCGGLLFPLCWLVARGLWSPEVMVIARSGAGLIQHGTTYPSPAALATTHDPNAYNPYLPVMSLFGLPRALVDSPLTDPRIWFGLVFVIVFWLALRRAGAQDPARWTVLVTGCPVIAFTLATGGDDAPMVAFLCLGFAYLWNDSPVKAGLALGVASAMKATAWPAVAVAIALLAAVSADTAAGRNGRGGRDGRDVEAGLDTVAAGRRSVAWFTLAAVGVVAVCAGPFLARYPKALIDNTVEFPLGLAHVVSAAASPLPGHLIAETGYIGHTFVIVVLALAGLAVAAYLILYPPRTVPRAMGLLAGAMTLMFLLAPSTRFGYFIYPLTLVIWLLAAMAGRRTAAGLTPGSGEPVASVPASPLTTPLLARPPASLATTVVPCGYDGNAQGRRRRRLSPRRRLDPFGMMVILI